MDLVGLARVRSVGGEWYAWVFFLEEKGEPFGFVRDLVLRLKNERHGDAMRAIAVTMAQNLKTLTS
jgi:hypothetical protein